MVTDNDCAVVMLDGRGVPVTVGVVFAGAVTTTVFVPVTLLYVEELAESGVKLAVSASVLVASDPAGMVIVALPLARVVADAVELALARVTVPVGVGLPLPPLTPMVTDNDCAVVMLDEPGVTVTVGVVFAGAVTTTVFVPVALLYVAELAE